MEEVKSGHVKFDYSYLVGFCKCNVGTLGEVAKQFGITPAGLRKKLNGECGFSQSQILDFAKKHNLTNDQIQLFFFKEKLVIGN